MLSMLEVLPPRKRGLVGRCVRYFFRPQVEGRIESVCSVCYVRIFSEQHRKGHDWRMIEAHSLDCAGRLLLPVGVSIPYGCELRQFVPSHFSRRMMENFAIDVLSQSELPPNRRKLALYGQESEIAMLLPALIPLIGELRIITRRAHAISDIVSDITRETGLPITLTDVPDASGYHILLAPSGGAAVIGADKNTLVISPDRPRQDVLEWVSGTSVDIPEVLRSVYRPFYKSFDFVAAFYEIAGMRDLGRIIPQTGLLESGDITAQKLAALLDRANIT